MKWDDDAEAALSDVATQRHADLINCCGNADWRGHFCPYHQGYSDGYWQGRADLAESA